MSQLRTLLSSSYVVQLLVIAKALGKRPFKRYLELFLDALFYGLVSLMQGYRIWGSLVYQFLVKMFAVVLSSSIDNKGKREIQSTLHFQLAVCVLVPKLDSVFCWCSKPLLVDLGMESPLVPYQNPKPSSKL